MIIENEWAILIFQTTLLQIVSVLWQLLITYSPCKRNPLWWMPDSQGALNVCQGGVPVLWAPSAPRMMSRWWKRVTCSLLPTINSSKSSLFVMPLINGRIIGMTV
ncbi:hypothetical protein CDAR_208831 [Caerostris darwini]|uniref:Uncharacterized protein n=1 Tax=Caerostris darwini TaxID=1538125 RepID=A0AAV4VRJ7_9ARAC|nr:hypothetical protein CDAR_208831 [Caerostris darwini]